MALGHEGKKGKRVAIESDQIYKYIIFVDPDCKTGNIYYICLKETKSVDVWADGFPNWVLSPDRLDSYGCWIPMDVDCAKI